MGQVNAKRGVRRGECPVLFISKKFPSVAILKFVEQFGGPE